MTGPALAVTTRLRRACRRAALVAALVLGATSAAGRESGGDLWLRYPRIEDQALREAYGRSASAIVVSTASPTGKLIAGELTRGLGGLLGADVPVLASPAGAGAIVAGTPETSALIAQLGLSQALARAGDEGYLIRTTKAGGHDATVIASRTETGALRGAFHYLRLLQTRQPVASLDITERPRMALRLLNHWDNLDGSIERGYAGASLWNVGRAARPRRSPRRGVRDAPTPRSASTASCSTTSTRGPSRSRAPYLEKTAALAGALRPYGIRVYLSANFAAPKTLGGLATADPLDPAVARWWREKADEIYGLIPDFGGFLVKANSEGQPGPQDYERTHADGANVLADAVAPARRHRACGARSCMTPSVDPDRVKRAYLEFAPLDGRFRDNVIVQVKNGPLDFQPREPFSPLFGAMPRTPLDGRTADHAGVPRTVDAPGLPGADVEGVPRRRHLRGRARIDGGEGRRRDRCTATGAPGSPAWPTPGSDANWTGHDFGQANWYAYGRLAWNPDLSAGDIADEWIG